MCSEQVEILWELMKLIERGEEITYALERHASILNINIERLREVMKDVDEKAAELSDSESGETGVFDPEDDWFGYPEAYS